MDRVIEEAERVYRRYGSDDLDYVAGKLGVEVHPVLDSENLREVYFGDLKAIVVKPDLPGHERRFLLAHGLGHYQLHGGASGGDFAGFHRESGCGNLEMGRVEVPRSEREANLFAAYLLVPGERLRAALQGEWVRESDDPVLKLALEFGAPVALMRERLIYEGIRR